MNNIPAATPSDFYYYYGNNNQELPSNKYVFIKKRPQVFVNPHFKKNNVFVNPNFSNKIHINPKKFSNQIYVNPNLIRNFQQTNVENLNMEQKIPEESRTIISTRTKIVKIPLSKPTLLMEPQKINENKVNTNRDLHRVRRTSIRSTYKIVKSKSSGFNNEKLPLRPYNKNVYKIDNTKKLIKIRKKYVYINKFATASDLSSKKYSNRKLNNSHLINISGILYKKSTHTLRRASLNKVKNRFKLIKKVLPTEKPKILSKMTKNKDIKKDTVKRYKIVRKSKQKLNTSSKFKKCNIPCIIYRKSGKCKAYDEGKCSKKHDPKQIMLCTRFLQGACLKNDCLLSHKVSPEKMPTCKYYLEGLCSKDDCPYLHVKINPKADICRDFLEGYCQRGIECDKRHQLLCPDFEKLGSCPKKRCAYPHGNLVRKYCANNNFCKTSAIKKKQIISSTISKTKPNAKIEDISSNRYYVENKKTIGLENCDIVTLPTLGERPKIGTLPSFIPLNNNSVT